MIENDAALMERWARISSQMHGTSLEHRRHGTNWPEPWRARIVATKNERDAFRIVGYGRTWQQAIGDALRQLP